MRKKAKLSMCRMDGCDHDADGALGFCKACYQFMYYWKQKSPKQVIARVDALERAERRMGTLIPSKVSRLKRRA